MRHLLIVGAALCGLSACADGGGSYNGGSGDALIAVGLEMMANSSRPHYAPAAFMPDYSTTTCRSTPWGAQCVTQ